jgi:small GTP-binding protein
MSKSKRIKLKICLLGDPAVGKTSLVQKFVYDFFSDSYMRTVGTKVSRKIIQYHEPISDINYEIVMMLWDIMGQKFSSMPLDNYLKMSHGALIVCDVTRKQTFENCREWKKNLVEGSGNVPIIYIANKIDLEKKLDFSLHEFQEFCKKDNVEYFLTSAKTGENVESAFQRLGELIITILKKPAPEVSEPKKKKLFPELDHIEEIIQQTVKRPKFVNGKITQRDNSGKSQDGQKGVSDSSLKIDASELKPGLAYIIKEETPNQSFQIFKSLFQQTKHGLCISRIHPSRLKEEFQIKDVPIYWLSSGTHKQKNVVAPKFLPQLNTILIDFIKKTENAVIILEGIEYLIEQNDFKTVLSLIHSLNDHIMGSNARVIIPIDPLILKEHEMHMLTRDLKVL